MRDWTSPGEAGAGKKAVRAGLFFGTCGVGISWIAEPEPHPPALRAQSIFIHYSSYFKTHHVSFRAQSIFAASRPSRATPEQLVRVWQHEALRVFHDRLTEAPLKKWLVETLHEVGA